MSEFSDIELAVKAILQEGNNQVILLKCTSAYPAPFDQMHLENMQVLASRFTTVTGLSDHSMAIEIPIASVALGARVVERHFIESRSDGGPDSSFSMEPDEFKQMVKSIRVVESACRKAPFGPTASEKGNIIFRRSLFVVKKILSGESFTVDNIRSIRPGSGLSPRFFEEILGKKALIDLEPGIPLKASNIVEFDINGMP
jgi:pseudaminic acid synthase